MGQPFVGEIRMFAGNFNPNGWAFCNGQLLPIAENDVLFTLIGTTYGGDGEETFALPNLQSRVPLHQGTLQGTPFIIGEQAGVESVTLTTQQIPVHNHLIAGSTAAGSQASPANNVPAANNLVSIYAASTTSAAMAAQMVNPSGGSQPHDNMQPFLCINYIISLFGIFPTQF
jgi:microcystin-dependent protein